MSDRRMHTVRARCERTSLIGVLGMLAGLLGCSPESDGSGAGEAARRDGDMA